MDDMLVTAPDILFVVLSDIVPQLSSAKPSPSLSLLSPHESLSAMNGLNSAVGSPPATAILSKEE